jgi:hypothetical protein
MNAAEASEAEVSQSVRRVIASCDAYVQRWIEAHRDPEWKRPAKPPEPSPAPVRSMSQKEWHLLERRMLMAMLRYEGILFRRREQEGDDPGYPQRAD